MHPVSPLGAAVPTPPAAEPQPAGSGEGFAERVGAALAEANQTLQSAERHGRDLAAGQVDVVETMIALGRADLSLRFVLSLRNRALEAYNEIMRLQI